MNPTILGVRLSMLLRFYGGVCSVTPPRSCWREAGSRWGSRWCSACSSPTGLNGSAGEILQAGRIGAAAACGSVGCVDERIASGRPVARRPSGRRAARERDAGRPAGSGRSSCRDGREQRQAQRLGAARLSAVALLVSGGLGSPWNWPTRSGSGGQPLTVLAAGEAHRSRPAGIGAAATGAMSNGPVTRSPLPSPRPRREARTGDAGTGRAMAGRPATGGQRTASAGRRALDVEPADNEARLLAQATKPNDQSTILFSAISVMVRVLLALNACCSPCPSSAGSSPNCACRAMIGKVLLLLGFEALMLGLAASLAGIVPGVLSKPSRPHPHVPGDRLPDQRSADHPPHDGAGGHRLRCACHRGRLAAAGLRPAPRALRRRGSPRGRRCGRGHRREDRAEARDRGCRIGHGGDRVGGAGARHDDPGRWRSGADHALSDPRGVRRGRPRTASDLRGRERQRALRSSIGAARHNQPVDRPRGHRGPGCIWEHRDRRRPPRSPAGIDGAIVNYFSTADIWVVNGATSSTPTASPPRPMPVRSGAYRVSPRCGPTREGCSTSVRAGCGCAPGRRGTRRCSKPVRW